MASATPQGPVTSPLAAALRIPSTQHPYGEGEPDNFANINGVPRSPQGSRAEAILDL